MARLESPDPVAEFRRRFGNPTDPKDTFEVLVRENWLQHGCKEKLFVLNRSRYYERSSFFREALDEADSSSSDRNTPKPIILENHMPDESSQRLAWWSAGMARSCWSRLHTLGSSLWTMRDPYV